jgi:hypothetical protein
MRAVLVQVGWGSKSLKASCYVVFWAPQCALAGAISGDGKRVERAVEDLTQGGGAGESMHHSRNLMLMTSYHSEPLRGTAAVCTGWEFSWRWQAR